MTTTIRRHRLILVSMAGLALVGAVALTGGAAASAATGHGNATSTNSSLTAVKEVKDGPDGPQITGTVAVPKGTAETTGASEQMTLLPLAKLSERAAMAAATAASPGPTATSAALEDADGFVVWGVSVKDATGVVMDVTVDAGTGKVLASEPSGDETGAQDSEKGATEAQGTDGVDAADAADATTNGWLRSILRRRVRSSNPWRPHPDVALQEQP